MNEEEMAELARQLAWPGIHRNDEEIDKLLATLPDLQAHELKEWIEIAREEFEEDYAEMHAELCEKCKEHKHWDEGRKETERLCQIIKFPLGNFDGEAP
jgi:hypothetical protein